MATTNEPHDSEKDQSLVPLWLAIEALKDAEAMWLSPCVGVEAVLGDGQPRRLRTA